MAFGNDSVGYVRVRKRSLKGGHPSWRAYRVATGSLSTASMTFDLVRTVRVGGKSRHNSPWSWFVEERAGRQSPGVVLGTCNSPHDRAWV